jgi:hypothetical protein
MIDDSADEDTTTAEPRRLTRVLSQLGAILAPAGLVALFCQAIDVSSQNTAAFSLLTVAVVTLLLFRHAINRTLPSTFALGLLVALGFVFFFSYKNILLKNTGLIRFFHQSNDYLGSIEEPINHARHDIWFFGTNFYISAGDRRTALLNALRRGVNVHYLIFNPNSSEFPRLARDFAQSEAELKAECAKGLISINELARAWHSIAPQSQTPGELQVRVYDVTPRGRMYVFDPGNDEGRTFLVPYVNNVNSAELPGFLLENIEAGVYKAYFTGVVKLWRSSTVLQLPAPPP